MAKDQTILFHSTIFGPVPRRPPGASLVVNPLPSDGTLWSFDFIYCEPAYNAPVPGQAGLASPA